MFESVIRELVDRIGEDGVSTDPADLTTYCYDASMVKGEACAVVFPRSTEEVSRILEITHRCGIPVFTRGAGTGLAGGSVPHGGIVLTTVRLRHLTIDRTKLTAHVGAGVTTRQLAHAAAEKGLFYPPDPGSGAVSTIGGNLATNAA
ncbi:MAG: FAD-binding oxidoreductase, partial [Alicyclobacillus sp.]|nr:FAD-binding oxidoreductase [Alicyclobacillus sp.]